MPMFVYTCSACHNEFERLVSYTQANDVDCPVCQEPRAHRKLTTFAIAVQSGTRSSVQGDIEASTCASGTCCSGPSCSLN
jgi:putative FmdB family regulatory protein